MTNRLCALFTLALLLAAGRAEPCVVVIPSHQLDPDEQRLDVRPPDAVSATVVRISRGHGPIDGQYTSCDDIGEIEIQLRRLKDDRTSWQQLGFSVVVLKGTPPENFRAPKYVLGFAPDLPSTELPRIAWVWTDGATDEQEPFDFTLGVKAVDRGGNESRKFATVRVRHPGGHTTR